MSELLSFNFDRFVGIPLNPSFHLSMRSRIYINCRGEWLTMRLGVHGMRGHGLAVGDGVRWASWMEVHLLQKDVVFMNPDMHY